MGMQDYTENVKDIATTAYCMPQSRRLRAVGGQCAAIYMSPMFTLGWPGHMNVITSYADIHMYTQPGSQLLKFIVLCVCVCVCVCV